MKKIFILVLSIILCSKIFPQGFSVSGQVADSSSKKVLEGANVTLTRLSNSQMKGKVTDNKGRFYIGELSPGKYSFNISFVGYKSYKQNIDIKNYSVDLKTIYLSPRGIKLGTVNVSARPIPVIIKQDTAEYNAHAFKTNKDANAQDLLTKMPGITVQNGTVQAQGENVQKVLVDGREFFGNDPNAVLKNLPAEIIDKIQVFDQQSDQSQFTGFDDGNTNKTINIVTRLNNRVGTFGRITGGYGPDQRYSGGGNVNFFNRDQRISIIAQINNVNQQNFSSEDLLGVMSGNGRNFRMMGGMGGGGGRAFSNNGNRVAINGGGPGGFGGPSISNFLVNQTAGLTDTRAIGINYSDRYGDKVELSGSYFFNSTNNNAVSTDYRNYFLALPAAQSYNEDNSSLTKNVNHRLNLRLNYQIDENNSILFYPTFTAQINNGLSNVNGITTAGADKLNSTSNFFNSNLTAINSSNNLLLRHRFDTPGRTISIGLNGTFTNNTGNNNLFAEDNYYSSVNTSDTVNQNSNLLKHGFSGSANIVYTEPIAVNSMLQFDSRFDYSENNSNQNTFDIVNNISSPDTSLSNVYKEFYRTQSFGAGYRFRERELSFALNLHYSFAQQANSQTFPQQGYMERSYQSLLPSLFLRYFISRTNNLRLSYSTSNEPPSIDQLQNVLNNSNPTQLSIGNPELKQDYRHSLVLRYIQINPDRMNSLFIMLGATAIQNYIGNNTIIAQNDTTLLTNIFLNKGTRLTIPENLNGYFNIRSFIVYGFPVDFLKSNLNLSLNGTFTRTPGVINNVLNYSNSNTIGGGIVLGSNISDKVDFTISSFSSYNFVKNSGVDQTLGSNNYFTDNASLRFYWRFWKGFVLQNELNDQYNSGQSGNSKPNILLWNINLGIKILNSDDGEIRLSVNDLLNQNTNFQHNVSDSYIEDVRTNVLGRYYLLSFVYSIRAY